MSFTYAYTVYARSSIYEMYNIQTVRSAVVYTYATIAHTYAHEQITNKQTGIVYEIK